MMGKLADKLSEKSKLDGALIVGSEIRAALQELCDEAQRWHERYLLEKAETPISGRESRCKKHDVVDCVECAIECIKSLGKQEHSFDRLTMDGCCTYCGISAMAPVTPENKYCTP